MNRWNDTAPLQTLAVWVVLAALLGLVNSLICRAGQVRTGTIGSFPSPTTAPDSAPQLPGVASVTAVQLVIILSWHAAFGAVWAGLGLERVAPVIGIDWPGVFVWTFNFTPQPRTYLTAFGVLWVLTIAYITCRKRKTLLGLLTYSTWRSRRGWWIAMATPPLIAAIVLTTHPERFADITAITPPLVMATSGLFIFILRRYYLRYVDWCRTAVGLPTGFTRLYRPPSYDPHD
ncbi:MAG: hypothetical protein Q4Q03_03030 [Bowdeniella nasicola]|nr:hypothetical protein [Bowdeniella nasicola]